MRPVCLVTAGPPYRLQVTPQEFHARVRAAADPSGRLPVPAQAGWEIFPFEESSVRVTPLAPPALPEPPRAGEGGRACGSCDGQFADAVWTSEHWVLVSGGPTGLPFQAVLLSRQHVDLDDLDDEPAADLGVLLVRIARLAGELPAVGRVHVNRWGDGGAHLHVWLMGRPAGMLQLRGSNLALWEEMLPRVPAEESAAALRHVARGLTAWGGSAR